MNPVNPNVLQAVFAQAVDAIIVIDESGTIHSVNPAVERMLGFAPQEVLGQPIDMLMPSPHRERHGAYVDHYLRTGERKIIGIGREVMAQAKSGELIPVHLAVSEVMVDGGRFFAGVLRDITEIKKAEQLLKEWNTELETRVKKRTLELQAMQSELAKGEKLAILGRLSAGIAHEIRGCLNALRTSNYYLLHAPDPLTNKQTEHVQRIERNVQHIERVVQALSDVTRHTEPNLKVVDARTLVQDLVAGMELPETIELALPDPAVRCEIMADPTQLGIVLRNLIQNGVDAMPEGGQLAIGLERGPDGVVLYVEDQGTGIAEEELARIAEPLYTTKPKGMGLGLSISRLLLARNRAELQIRSRPGEGSRFSIVFRSES